jgi:bacterioferritin
MSASIQPARLMELLGQAVQREVQVSVQYMLQHAIGAARWGDAKDKTADGTRRKFVASHTYYAMPGDRLKKVAITEMRHAEAIGERIVTLGGAIPTAQNPIVLGETAEQMIERDREEERQAIALYQEIIAVATATGDGDTAGLFRAILRDEEGHHATFEKLLARA